jgi:hypothetical protein
VNYESSGTIRAFSQIFIRDTYRSGSEPPYDFSEMMISTKKRAFAAAVLVSLFLGGCHPGGDPGDPNVGANPGPIVSSIPGGRPGTPGGPELKPPPPKDPYGGRSGAAAGGPQ